MRMFHWYSTWLKNYALGDIVVLALDVEEARQLVRERFNDWLREERSWLNPADEDDAEYIDELWQRMEADLAKEPSEDRVLLIRGGE